MTERRLSVRLHGVPLATLTQDDSGQLSLRYLDTADRPLSLGLPLQEAPHGHAACEAYFGGLLPEGDAARVAIARRFGANARNTFSLLGAIGRECAGAVSLHDPADVPRPDDDVPPMLRVLDDAELAAHLRDLPRKPLFLGVDGLRLSLAGTQDKAAVCMIDGQPALPLAGTPSTHILKPSHDRLPHTVENEWLCLSLARQAGFAVPAVEIRTADGLPYLLIERYDRHVAPDGRVRRIHQEDFCQALGVPSALKYQADGGPGLAACFALAERLAAPGVARTDLLRRAVFNFLVGNGDAHAKNFAILHPAAGGSRLAPAYDLLSTRFYPDLSDRMAMKVGNSYRVDDMTAARWRRLCEDAQLGFPLLRRAMADVNAALQAAVAHLLAQGPDPARQALLAFIRDHAATLAARFEAQVAHGRGGKPAS